MLTPPNGLLTLLGQKITAQHQPTSALVASPYALSNKLSLHPPLPPTRTPFARLLPDIRAPTPSPPNEVLQVLECGTSPAAHSSRTHTTQQPTPLVQPSTSPPLAFRHNHQRTEARGHNPLASEATCACSRQDAARIYSCVMPAARCASQIFFSSR